MYYIGLAIVGLITGIISRFLYPGEVPMGLIMSMVLGIAGSFLAGFIGSMIHRRADKAAFSRAGFIYSIIGSMLLIFLARNVFHWV